MLPCYAARMLSRFRTSVAVSFLLLGRAVAGELPAFSTDEEADAWLRSQSPFYATMAADVESRGSYHFTVQPDTPKAGDVHFVEGQRYIALGAELEGAHRVSVLIFEMTNAF